MSKPEDQVLCAREDCGHQKQHHAISPSNGASRCLGCMRCFVFMAPAEPAKVTLLADELEGFKAEISFANSLVEEANEKLKRLEELRRNAQDTASRLTRDNFDLMRQKARVEAKLSCAQGRHGITVGEGDREQCKECGRMVNDDSWRNRPPVMVSLEVAANAYVGPFVLITPEERESWAINWDRAAELVDGYLDRIIELEATFGVESDPEDLADEIAAEQVEQEALEAEAERLAAEEGWPEAGVHWQRLVTFGEE